MRRFLRAIAHGAMEAQGIQKPNRRHADGRSYFAKRWHEYC